MNLDRKPGIWFPAVRSGSGTDVFTERLVGELHKRGFRAQATWLPLRSEYAPWSVGTPRPPRWADIVHINTWLNPRFLPDDLPVVATLHHATHHPDLECRKGPMRWAYHKYWIRPAERRTLERADEIVAVSQYAADTARATLLDRPMRVIRNAVDTEYFRPLAPRSMHKPFRLLYIGKWASLKGVHQLAPIMRELGKGFELRYTGGVAAGKDRVAMPANMHDIGRLEGSDAVIAEMQVSDALLFPSHSEGFPMVVVEALSCGLPVIASNVPSLGEAVQDEESGYLVQTDHVAGFAVACRTLAEDERRYRAMAESARGRAVSQFSIESMVDAYVDVYRRLGG